MNYECRSHLNHCCGAESLALPYKPSYIVIFRRNTSCSYHRLTPKSGTVTLNVMTHSRKRVIVVTVVYESSITFMSLLHILTHIYTAYVLHVASHNTPVIYFLFSFFMKTCYILNTNTYKEIKKLARR